MKLNSSSNINKFAIKVLAITLFIIGLAITLYVNILSLWVNLEGMSFWGYPEALAFDSSLTTNARLTSLKCPTILAPNETGEIKVIVKNPNTEEITTWVSAHISMPNAHEDMVRETKYALLQPKDNTTFVWSVNQNNLINKRTIMVRVFLRLTEAHPPARTKHCGIVTIDLWGLPGKTLTALFFLVGHTFQIGGIWLYWHILEKRQKTNNLPLIVTIALSLLSAVMTYGSLAHSWVFGMVALLLSLLIFFTFLGYGFGSFENSSS